MKIALNIICYSLFGYTLVLKDYILIASIALNILLAFFFYKKYYLNRNHFVKIRIKKHKPDFPEYKIKIRNVGVIPLEMDPPVVIFKKRGAKRLFQVRNGLTVFPLSLFPKEEYDFFVDLARFYTTDSSLITYTKVILEVRDKAQHKVSRKRIRIK